MRDILNELKNLIEKKQVTYGYSTSGEPIWRIDVKELKKSFSEKQEEEK